MDKLKEFFKELEEKQDRTLICVEQLDFLSELHRIQQEVK